MFQGDNDLENWTGHWESFSFLDFVNSLMKNEGLPSGMSVGARAWPDR